MSFNHSDMLRNREALCPFLETTLQWPNTLNQVLAQSCFLGIQWKKHSKPSCYSIAPENRNLPADQGSHGQERLSSSSVNFMSDWTCSAKHLTCQWHPNLSFRQKPCHPGFCFESIAASAEYAKEPHLYELWYAVGDQNFIPQPAEQPTSYKHKSQT